MIDVASTTRRRSNQGAYYARRCSGDDNDEGIFLFCWMSYMTRTDLQSCL